MTNDEIRSALGLAGAVPNDTEYAVSGTHVDATVPADRLREVVQVLRDNEFLIEDLSAVDADPDLMGLYHFCRTDRACRVTLRSLTGRNAPELPSIQGIYPGANWHEREAHDFFGLVFTGHPDLSVLILPEDAGDLRPLRKAPEKLKALGEVIPLFAPPVAAAAADSSEGKA
ncbi:MAG: NADH-quinone oxidoreductase subunit C [Deferrisomatales bacterium]|nr:NADH-quinone oxidoreductase subunit C [Deferrisomatales bacterium]